MSRVFSASSSGAWHPRFHAAVLGSPSIEAGRALKPCYRPSSDTAMPASTYLVNPMICSVVK